MTPGRPAVVVALAAGAGICAFGVWTAFDTAAATRPREFFVWLAAAGIVHDAVVAPLVCGAGALLARAVREPWRSPVRAACVVSAVVVVVGWPAWRGYGRDRIPDNSSALPLDYTTALLTVLGAVWLGAAVWAAGRARRRVTPRPPPGSRRAAPGRAG